jgi:hypothetical protein
VRGSAGGLVPTTAAWRAETRQAERRSFEVMRERRTDGPRESDLCGEDERGGAGLRKF